MKKSQLVVGVASVVALTVGLAAQGAKAGEAKKAAPLKNIVQVAREAGSFNTLIAALEKTGLIGTLSGQGHGPFTVFAPTDDAFAKLPPGTVETLLQNPTALKNILLYHVVAGAVPASQVVGLSSAPTLNGQSVTITVAGGNVFLNGTTKVVATDVMARNGIIHVIDSVLLPGN